MKPFLHLSPLAKTILWCCAAEIVILSLLMLLMHSFGNALWFSISVLGPASAWFSPMVLEHYRSVDHIAGRVAGNHPQR